MPQPLHPSRKKLSQKGDWVTGGITEKLEGQGYFYLLHRVQTGSGIHSLSYSMDTGGYSLGIKQLEQKADHSPS
jgi:hypothetical protein